MARLESIAKAGYFPTPRSVVERIAALIRPAAHSPRQAVRSPEFAFASCHFLPLFTLTTSRLRVEECELRGHPVSHHEGAGQP
jgi:hypothetical protein